MLVLDRYPPRHRDTGLNEAVLDNKTQLRNLWMLILQILNLLIIAFFQTLYLFDKVTYCEHGW